MGQAVKFGKGVAIKPPLEFPSQLLAIEQSFYQALKPSVSLALQASEPKAAPLWERFKTLWESYALHGKTRPELYHDNFAGSYSQESFIDDKTSNLQTMESIAGTRKSVAIKLTARAAAVTENTAFLVADYSWQYIVGENLLLREDGISAQTWLKGEEGWQLLGQFIDQLFVEPVVP